MFKWSLTIVVWRNTVTKAFSTCRPTTIDSSRHLFNSDRSQLIIKSVSRSDYGEYICTAINKIAESSATIMLHVFGLFMLIVHWLISVNFGKVVLNDVSFQRPQRCLCQQSSRRCPWVSVCLCPVMSLATPILSCTGSTSIMDAKWWEANLKTITQMDPLFIKSCEFDVFVVDRKTPRAISTFLRVCWWSRIWGPLMVDCIPAWLSAPLETHQETCPFWVRLSCHI